MYVIRSDGVRYIFIIRLVFVSLYGVEFKFVVNGIESIIRMEVRGRGLVGDFWVFLVGFFGRGVG